MSDGSITLDLSSFSAEDRQRRAVRSAGNSGVSEPLSGEKCLDSIEGRHLETASKFGINPKVFNGQQHSLLIYICL